MVWNLTYLCPNNSNKELSWDFGPILLGVSSIQRAEKDGLWDSKDLVWKGGRGSKVANPNDSTKAQFNNSGEKKSAILQNVGFGWFRFDSVPLVKCACRGLRQTNIYKCSNRTDNCIFICTRSTSHHPENIYIYILYIFRCTYIGAHLAGAKSISRFDSILHLVEVESSMGRRFHSFIHSMASHW